MPLTVEVSLLSGRRVSLAAEPDESVEAFKSRAQEALAVGRGRLLDSSGGVLKGPATLEEFRLKSGDELVLNLSSVQVLGAEGAFAARATGPS